MKYRQERSLISSPTWTLSLLLLFIVILYYCKHDVSSTTIITDDYQRMLNINDDDQLGSIGSGKTNPTNIKTVGEYSQPFSSHQSLDLTRLVEDDDASTNQVAASNSSQHVCPFILYGKHWDEYKTNSKNRNTKFNSERERMFNERVFLFNQTEWTFKFPEQKNPLTCPKFTLNKWRRYVPMVNPDENILYYLGKEVEFCKSYDKWTYEQKFLINGTIVVKNVTEYFNFGQVCDKLFCFPQNLLDLVRNDNFRYGLNFTELITNSTIFLNMFPQRVVLQFLEKWAISYDDNLEHDFDPQTLEVSQQLNKIMHQIVPFLPFNFTNLNQIAEYYTACNTCRDYNKYPVLPSRDVCIAIDFPFECNYGNRNSTNHLRDGYPLIEMVSRRNSIFRNVMNMTAEPLCYCPRPGSVKVNALGNDVIFSEVSFFSTKVASQCDVFTQFWYPLHDSKFLSIILVMLEILLNFLLFGIVLVPLLIQFTKEVFMKLRGKPFKIPKLRSILSNHDKTFAKIIEKNSQARNANKSTEFSNTLFMFTTSAYNKRSWKRILFDLRLYSALALQMGYLCFLASDILGTSSTIESPTEINTSESVMFLTGSGFTLIGTMPILAMWVDVMKKTENNSERISLKISIPLFLFMTFGVAGVVAYAITDYFSSFFSSAVFMLCLVVIFVCVIIGLFIYGFKIYWNLRKVSRINFFQFRFTRFLVASSFFVIFPAFYMVFDIATSIYQSESGLYPSNRFYYLYSPFITSIFLLAYGSSLIYVLFPSMKLLMESYRLFVYCTLCCCGKSPRVKAFMKKHQEYRDEYEGSWDNLSENGSVQVGRLPYLVTKSQKSLKSVEGTTFDDLSINLNHSSITINGENLQNLDAIPVDDSIYYENQIDSSPKTEKQKELSQPLL
ncbi:predicted protein [Naegleria gruberi]|uniref:Predicted protein n=2 Tax=Naegleria gruberi TaxID=5762 RepID=D2VGD8_NAEGR|nr:uncharacterized protein NAEGRDRAFT_49322 [Naegleria gruberi]EFC43947.1 predicted protein [Naegleria gruberi]|eukprot:XP_002676691.1 predicted protein [Naegleria gruberi strain NEG-M]